MQPNILYRAYRADGVLLYVGATTNPRNRLTTHAHKAHWWQETANITFEHFDDPRALLIAEKEAIEAEAPEYNIIHSEWNTFIRARKRPRPKGSGTIYRRADGYWVAGIELPHYPNGKRRYIRKVRKTRESALLALEELNKAHGHAD